MKKTLLFSCFWYFGLTFIFTTVLIAQQGQSQSADLESTQNWMSPQEAQNFEWLISEANSSFYAILKLSYDPSALELSELETQSISLVEAITSRIYLFQLSNPSDFQQLPVEGVLPFSGNFKLSKRLRHGIFPDHAYQNGLLYVNIWPFPNADSDDLQNKISAITDLEILSISESYIQLSVPIENLESLANLQEVFYIEPKMPAPVAEGIGGRNLHRLNLLSSQAGIGFDGNNIGIAIGDDGHVNHIDFQGRITQLANENGNTHGDMTAGLAIGAGNINPLARGAASASHLKLYFIGNYPHIANAPINFQEDRIMLTSTSFLEDCGGYYTQSASELDAQVYNYEELLHIFSAGNSSVSACNGEYGHIVDQNGRRFGNITGGRKSAKAAIAVANTYSDGSLHATSSRGPTADGRIKPDLAAYGQGQLTTDDNNTYQEGSGTSAAAPTVAGLSACLYEAYETQYQSLPSSALIKATLLNTAIDQGRPGPDYEYGWGQVHAGNALKLLQNGNFIADQITNNSSKTYSLNVPSGTNQMKVMLYWNDRAGSLFASRALVNDLDLKVVQNNGTTVYPWTLSAAPHLDSLTRPAIRGVDHKNNMEQVSIDNPTPGTYQIQVNGFQVPQGAQKFYIVYFFDNTSLELTFPKGEEALVPNDDITVQWDAFGDQGNFQVEWAPSNSNSWNIIAQNVPGHKRTADWTIPSNWAGAYKIRVRRGSQISQTFPYFSVLKQPNFNIQSVSPTQARVNWAPVTAADNYDIYMLGEKYMEKIGNSPSNSFLFNTENSNEHWIAIVAKQGNNISSRRTLAKHYIHESCGFTIQIALNFDNHPGETSWDIKDQNNSIVASGGPYHNAQPNSSISENICLPMGCYTLSVKDQGQNGMCCNNGNGSFTLKHLFGQNIAAGGNFNSSISHSFCLETFQEELNASIVQKQDVECNGDSNGWAQIQATGGTGNYSFFWSNGNQGPIVSGLSAGIYNVTISDGQQQVIRSLVIQQPNALAVNLNSSQSNCLGLNGSLSAQISGGVAPYDFQWSNGMSGSSINNLSSGNYSLTITDSNGCQISASQTISSGSNMQISPQLTPISCYGENDGSAFIQVSNAVWPVTFNWNVGLSGQGLYGLSAGNYSVTIIDAIGCEKVELIEIQQPSPLSANIQLENATCYDTNDGKLEAQVSGGTLPYTYQWSTGSNTSSINNLGKGWYFLTLTDANGCQEVNYYFINAPSQIVIDAQVMDSNGNNGEIDLTVSGGNPPYTYIWSNGSMTEDLNGLAPGQYEIEVLDANSCSSIKVFTIQDIDGDYCNSTGISTAFEWIESISVGGFTNFSGNNGGYGNFTSSTISMNIGSNYSVKLEPGYTSSAFNESWRIWIDANQDGDFDDLNEQVFASPLSNSIINGIISLPSNTMSGFTRMRISMKYGSPPNHCGSIGYGEVEDYTIFIPNGNLAALPETTIDGNALLNNSNETLIKGEVKVFPNPTSNVLNVQFAETALNTTLELISSDGKKVLSKNAEITNTIDISHLPTGIYWLKTQYEQESIIKKIVITR